MTTTSCPEIAAFPTTCDNNREVAQLFDRVAPDYDRISNSYTLARRAEALAQFVRGRSIEMGGGTAAITACLPDRRQAFHSDISLGMCRVAQQKLARPSVCFDAECTPLRDASVDTVVSAEMIYYLRRPERFLAEAFRVLCPGGRLVLSTTNPMMTILDRGRTLLRRLGFGGMFFDDGSPRFPSWASIRAMLGEAGFHVEHIGGIVPLPFAILDPLNRIIERTPLRRLSLFLIVVASKP